MTRDPRTIAIRHPYADIGPLGWLTPNPFGCVCRAGVTCLAHYPDKNN